VFAIPAWKSVNSVSVAPSPVRQKSENTESVNISCRPVLLHGGGTITPKRRQAIRELYEAYLAEYQLTRGERRSSEISILTARSGKFISCLFAVEIGSARRVLAG
jgi:hypothetical protein